MRVVIAKMDHETNTFSPISTTRERFEDRISAFGHEAVVKLLKGQRFPASAFIDLAEREGLEYVAPVAAEAWPGGRVTDDAFEPIVEAMCDAVAAGCDGAMFDLHGATVTESCPDGEGAMLERIREVAPELPIAVSLDMHANLTQLMVENATAIVGYKKYPHADAYETGVRAGQILLAHLRGETAPVMEWGGLPLLAQTLRMGHDDEPMGSIQQMTRDLERGRVLAATVFGGFPLADFADAGLSAIVVADGDRGAARAAAEKLLGTCWERREEFVYRGEPLEAALERASRLEEHPVVLLDHADNVASGGTCDVMTVIRAILEKGLDSVAVGPVWDPAAVKIMQQAGEGAEVTLDLGGKTDMPSIGLEGEPLTITGRVAALSDGTFVVAGEMNRGFTVRMGDTAVLDAGKVKIVVSSLRIEPWDPAVFTGVGIDPVKMKYLVLKSRIHYRNGFAAMARHTVTCDGRGVTSSDNGLFDFRHVRRPIYPLDADAAWPED
jgi:microcystin degradation protein MlrC